MSRAGSMPHSLTIERAQLRVAVLLDHEHEIVVGDEVVDRVVEREGAHAQHVEVLAAAP